MSEVKYFIFSALIQINDIDKFDKLITKVIFFFDLDNR